MLDCRSRRSLALRRRRRPPRVVRHQAAADERGTERHGERRAERLGCSPDGSRSTPSYVCGSATHTRSTATMSKRFSTLAATAIAGSIGIGSALVATATPASAASGTAKITVSNSAGVGWCASMSGYIPMGDYETHGYLNNGAMFGFDV